MADSSITIVGSLGRDPELRFTTGGRSLCSFTVAVSDRRKVGDDWKEDTSWVDVTCWASLAENVAATCSKGTRVVVTGRIKQDNWDDKETGQKRSKLAVTADEVGVSLRWARAEVERIEREKPDSGGGRRGKDAAPDEEPF